MRCMHVSILQPIHTGSGVPFRYDVVLLLLTTMNNRLKLSIVCIYDEYTPECYACTVHVTRRMVCAGTHTY
jgi:hypothetical protein